MRTHHKRCRNTVRGICHGAIQTPKLAPKLVPVFCYAHKVVKKNNYIHAYKQGVPNRKRFQRFQMHKGATCPRYFTDFKSLKDVKVRTGFKSFQGFGSIRGFQVVRRVKCFRSVEGFENPKVTKA